MPAADVRRLGNRTVQRTTSWWTSSLVALEADGDEGVNQGLLVLEARFALNVMGHFGFPFVGFRKTEEASGTPMPRSFPPSRLISQALRGA